MSVLGRFQQATQASDVTFGIADDRDGGDLLRALLARPRVVAAGRLWSAGTNLAHDSDSS